MDLIQLLPDSVANQIAAGEVIQRPASMVKELVENSVDAGARRIDIIAIDAGRTSLQVIDDGSGMSETDARLAFERHATSKIRQAADLFTLTTMGFRGEALPSIAAVAQVELQTRTADQELGTHLVLEGSRVVSQEPVACPVGANFLVKNLFFNVPARRKFLKSNNTELSNITAELERIVLVHPDIAFTLTSNGVTLMSLTPSSLKGRIAAVFGSRLADKLLTVEVQTPMVTIHGFIGTPESSRKRRKLSRSSFHPTSRCPISFILMLSQQTLMSISTRPRQKLSSRTNRPFGKYCLPLSVRHSDDMPPFPLLISTLRGDLPTFLFTIRWTPLHLYHVSLSFRSIPPTILFTTT